MFWRVVWFYFDLDCLFNSDQLERLQSGWQLSLSFFERERERERHLYLPQLGIEPATCVCSLTGN